MYSGVLFNRIIQSLGSFRHSVLYLILEHGQETHFAAVEYSARSKIHIVPLFGIESLVFALVREEKNIATLTDKHTVLNI